MKQPISSFRINLTMVVATICLHGAMMVANELFFRRAEFLQGIGWIYLPAGTRLLCTLLFGPAGAAGLLIAGWFACYWYYFPGDALRATSGTIAGAIGPYLVYLAAQARYGWQASLTNLTPQRLLYCALGCSLASPLLHHLWFSLHGDDNLLPGLFVMIVGDLLGTLMVLYLAKWLLSLLPAPQRRPG
jgi:hypothetical protein